MAKATAKVEKGIVQIRFPVDETKAYPDATFQALTQAAYAYRKLVLLMVSRVGRKPKGNGLDPHILEIIDDMIDGWAHECEFGGLAQLTSEEDRASVQFTEADDERARQCLVNAARIYRFFANEMAKKYRKAEELLLLYSEDLEACDITINAWALSACLFQNGGELEKAAFGTTTY